MSENNLIIKKSKKLKGDDGYRTFSIRIKEETVKERELISEQSGRSRNELIGKFLDFAIKRCVIRGLNSPSF